MGLRGDRPLPRSGVELLLMREFGWSQAALNETPAYRIEEALDFITAWNMVQAERSEERG